MNIYIAEMCNGLIIMPCTCTTDRFKLPHKNKSVWAREQQATNVKPASVPLGTVPSMCQQFVFLANKYMHTEYAERYLILQPRTEVRVGWLVAHTVLDKATGVNLQLGECRN